MKRAILIVWLAVIFFVPVVAQSFELPFEDVRAGYFLDVRCGKAYQGVFMPVFSIPVKIDLLLSVAAVEIDDQKYRPAGVLHADIKSVAELLKMKFLLKENIDFGAFFSKRPGDSMYGIFIAIK